MDFNPDKCEFLRITLKRKPIISEYTIHNKVLQPVSSAKYLGVALDSKLTFNSHIDNITKKANATRAFIARTTKFCPRQVRADSYTTYVRPLLEYASAVWNPHTDKNIAPLEAVQRRAARSVTKDYRRTSSVTAMLTQLEWKSLCGRRAQTRAILCYKIVHGLIDIPSNPYFVINNNPTRATIPDTLYPIPEYLHINSVFSQQL